MRAVQNATDTSACHASCAVACRSADQRPDRRHLHPGRPGIGGLKFEGARRSGRGLGRSAALIPGLTPVRAPERSRHDVRWRLYQSILRLQGRRPRSRHTGLRGLPSERMLDRGPLPGMSRLNQSDHADESSPARNASSPVKVWSISRLGVARSRVWTLLLRDSASRFSQ